jgi:hypothetical protein
MFSSGGTQEEQMMTVRTPRFLLIFAAVLLITGAASHAAAFNNALPIIDASGLPLFYSHSFKALWLADSATLFVLAAIFAVIAARFQMATRSLLILLALIPIATTILLYTFLGNFFAGHLFLAIAALVILAAVRLPRSAGLTGSNNQHDPPVPAACRTGVMSTNWDEGPSH